MSRQTVAESVGSTVRMKWLTSSSTAPGGCPSTAYARTACRNSAITVAACNEWPATSPIATSSRPSSMVSS